MQLITPRSASRGGLVAVVGGTLVGAILLVGGLAIGWLAFGTPFIERFTPTGRPGPAQMAMGMLAWSFALVAPATFIIVGLARIVTVVDGVASRRPPATPTSRLARVLSDEYVAASRVRLSDGRLVPELVLGPHGAAVIEEVPPAAASRHRGDVWEVRMKDGRWMPLENPLDRASRDAERVRRWFAEDDSDFLVKVFAAVISPDPTLPRSATCAVITAAQIPAWLASLPAQRSLTPSRRERLVEMLRELA